MLITLGLYIKGDALDPEKVTEILQVSPSRTRYKGQTTVTSTDKLVVAQTGLWSLNVDDDMKTLPLGSQLVHLKAKLDEGWAQISKIINVEESYIDVFISVSKVDGDSSTCEFELSANDITALQQIGIPVRVAIYA